ncbi:MAG: DegT/DnrJ/EryC1/StrS family aminotransferase [Sphaerochaetaceae bacterium]|nr:DegT/DnrJ/EryC1/StrS family aminotransferase [Sphaerochaetaceae bacterium]
MIRFYKPTVKRRDMESVLQTMVDEQIGPGEKNQAFMQAFAETTGCQTASAFRTYPDCIRAAFRIMDVCAETVVAISPLAPHIYKTVSEEFGCKLVMVDVDKEHGLVSEQAVSESGADLLVLYDSCSCLPIRYDVETSSAVKCDYGNVRVIEDVTESVGGRYGELCKAGDWGKLVICALEEKDIISCGGGAALGAKNDMIYKLRSNRPSDYVKLADINAALGSVQLANLTENSEKNRKICAGYRDALAKTAHKGFGLGLRDFESSGSVFPVFLNTKPEDIVKFANKHDVPVKLTFENSVCSDYEGDMFSQFPVAAAYFYRTVSFPVYPFLKNNEIDEISRIISHLP